MKKLVLIMALAVSGIANAQTGDWYVGGELGFGSAKVDVGGATAKGSVWSVSPEVGFNLNETVQLGLALNISGTTTGKDTPVETKTTAIDPVLYIRKFFPMGDQFALFGGVYAQLLNGKTKVNDNDDSKYSGFAGDLKCGVAFYPSERWTILGEFGLFNFTSRKTTDEVTDVETKETSWLLGLNTLGPVFDIGFYYTFIKK